MEFATIGLRSDTRGLKKGEAGLNKLAATGELTERRVKKSAVEMSGAMNMVGNSATRMAAGFGAAIGAFLGGKLFLGAIREQEQLQRNMRKTRQIIETTGGAAGKSANQLHEDARAFARVTLLSTEAIMNAQQVMLTFRNISGDTFDRAQIAAADLAESIGTDLSSAILQVSKALEDPVTGMNALTRSGTVFTQAQKDMVKEMVRVGDVAGAQNFILGELEKQYGGVAVAAANGLAGVQDDLVQSFQEFNIALAVTAGLGTGAAAVMGALSGSLDFMAKNMDTVVNTGIVAISILAKLAIGALGFAGALGVVKVALMATGIGAIIVALGVALTWFMKLTRGVGGFGAAMVLAKDVAAEAFGNINLLTEIVGIKFELIVLGMRRVWFTMLDAMSSKYANFVNGTRGFLANIAGALNPNMTAAEILAEAGPAFEVASVTSALADIATETETATNKLYAYSDAIGAASPEWAKLKEAMSDPETDADSAATALAELVESLETVPTASTGAAGGLSAVQDAAKKMADTIKGYVVSAVDSVANAFASFVTGGLKDFKGFISAVWKSFVQLLTQMIALAAKNKIMIALGMGGASGGGVGSAIAGALGGGGGAGGGLLAGLLGSFGTAGAGGAAATGLLGGLGSTLGVGAAAGASTGLFGIGAGAAAAGGGIMATIGAALPIIGIGLLLFSLFKKKPVMKAKDFKAIQSGLELTGMALFDTSRAGQKTAKNLMKAAGGIENFTKITKSYYDNFFTNEEKRQKAIDGISDVFSELGLAVPATAMAFRKVVEAQDLTTKSGREAYAALLGVSEAFAAVYGGVNDVTNVLVGLNAAMGGNIFATLVDAQRAAAYQANGIGFDVINPDRAGAGFAYRGEGPRITLSPVEAEIASAQKELVAGTGEISRLAALLAKSNQRMLDTFDSWDSVGLPATRT